jgi:DNA-binding transcriptional ArsR family regulator
VSDAVFTALADPTRRAVLEAVAEDGPASATVLSARFPVTRQAVAKHLAALQRAGLVQPHREGRETRYTLTPAPLVDAMGWMAEVGADWDQRLARLAERARG